MLRRDVDGLRPVLRRVVELPAIAVERTRRARRGSGDRRENRRRRKHRRRRSQWASARWNSAPARRRASGRGGGRSLGASRRARRHPIELCGSVNKTAELGAGEPRGSARDAGGSRLRRQGAPLLARAAGASLSRRALSPSALLPPSGIDRSVRHRRPPVDVGRRVGLDGFALAMPSVITAPPPCRSCGGRRRADLRRRARRSPGGDSLRKGGESCSSRIEKDRAGSSGIEQDRARPVRR